MSTEAINLSVDLKRMDNNQSLQLKAVMTANSNESDASLIERLMSDEHVDPENHELIDYQVDQAQIEMF